MDMMLFDYVSLSNTPLPALIEDSMTLKQIEDEAMIKLFELFNESKKQVFVAIDKAESYSDDIQYRQYLVRLQYWNYLPDMNCLVELGINLRKNK